MVFARRYFHLPRLGLFWLKDELFLANKIGSGLLIHQCGNFFLRGNFWNILRGYFQNWDDRIRGWAVLYEFILISTRFEFWISKLQRKLSCCIAGWWITGSGWRWSSFCCVYAVVGSGQRCRRFGSESGHECLSLLSLEIVIAFIYYWWRQQASVVDTFHWKRREEQRRARSKGIFGVIEVADWAVELLG